MLTNTLSKGFKSYNYSALFPIFLLLFIFYSQTSCSGEMNEHEGINKQTKKVHFKGNEIELGKIKVIPFAYRETMEQLQAMFLFTTLPDSVSLKDWKTGYYQMQAVNYDTIPIALNGKPIFGNEPKYMLPSASTKFSVPVLIDKQTDCKKFVFSKLSKELNQLEDGYYILNLNKLVVDDKGNLVYYEPKGIEVYMFSGENNPIIKDDIRNAIQQKLVETLSGTIKFKPAENEGKKVNSRLNLDNFQVLVKDHKAILQEGGGC